MAHDQSELLQGTLELLILKTLSLEPLHGWGISLRIRQMSREVFQVNQGSLYPALQRMKSKGWIRSEWRTRTGCSTRPEAQHEMDRRVA